MEQRQNTGSIRDFLTVLFKHKSRIVTIFLATVITVTVGSFLIPPTYEAKSSLLVKIGREYINVPEVGETKNLMSLNQEEVINSEIEILKNRDLIEKVINAIEVKNIYPELAENPPSKMTPSEVTILNFEKKLTVEGIKKSNVIEVSFQHKDPRIAAKAVNLLVDLFKEKHLQVFSEPKSSFLEQQFKAYEEKLKESENNLEAFKQKNRVFSIDEQRSLLLKQQTELDTSFKNTQNHIDELREKLFSLKKQKKAITEDKALYTQTYRDTIIVDARARLLSLQLNEQELLRKYNENNRLVVNVRKEIQLVKDFLREQEKDISSWVRTGNAVYQEVEKEIVKTEADLNSQDAKASTIRVQLNKLDKEIQSLDLKENEIQNLKRDLSLNEKNYRTYVDKLEEARISEDMNRKKMANISVIQKAAIPAKPVKPKKALNIMLGTILGAVSGLGFAFFSEYTAQGISTPESAEKRLGLSVLTTVSYKK